jgi:hypothetical protein
VPAADPLLRHRRPRRPINALASSSAATAAVQRCLAAVDMTALAICRPTRAPALQAVTGVRIAVPPPAGTEGCGPLGATPLPQADESECGALGDNASPPETVQKLGVSCPPLAVAGREAEASLILLRICR